LLLFGTRTKEGTKLPASILIRQGNHASQTVVEGSSFVSTDLDSQSGKTPKAVQNKYKTTDVFFKK
jgi:hypothetical protein